MSDRDELAVLSEYAAGHSGTRATIERLGLNDYADLIIALAPMTCLFQSPTTRQSLGRIESGRGKSSCPD